TTIANIITGMSIPNTTHNFDFWALCQIVLVTLLSHLIFNCVEPIKSNKNSVNMSLRKCTPLSACGCLAKLMLCLHLSYLGLSSRRSLRTFPTFHMVIYLLLSFSFVVYTAREEDF